MEFKEILHKRRSVRKFSDRPVPHEVIDCLTEATLTAPSSRNTRSTHLIVVERREVIAHMAEMRDYGAAFLKDAPLVIVLAGDTSVDLWRENGAIAATTLQFAAVDSGLASCWVHIDGRPRLREQPAGETATDYLRTLIPIPEGCAPLCAIALGYSDFTPADLPPFTPATRITFVR